MMAHQNKTDHLEEGIEVPYDQLDPATLRNVIEEFVTREWSELSDTGYSLEDKIEQVLQQLKEKKAKVVFDFTSNTANIVACR
jgi:uncharacterized protein YheU (UPF0270 family)